ncbi:MAG: hypothetical protein DCC75_04725 [Proteobacteria bacterium]|nr:MAG: hypothetical protein DCC75_04725 [Pseudomonadota bacterium]
MSDDQNDPAKPPRKRGMTSLMLGWLAEKLRRAEQLKTDIDTGKYKVDSEKIAKSMLNHGES